MLNSLSHLDEEHRRRWDISPLFIGLFGIFAGAIIVATVHCISRTCCSQRRTLSPANRRQTAQISRVESQSSTGASTSTNTSNSTVQLLPVYRYTKECKEGTCAVCLGEFSEGEEVRVLPECAHSFHAPCIDMWLYSHPNCPLCRADTMPPRQHVAVLLPDPGGVPPPELSRIM